MDIDTVLKKYKNKLKNYNIPYTDYTQTITCGLSSIVHKDIYVINPPHISTNNLLKWNYNTDKTCPVNIFTAIHNTVGWISDLKVYTSLFNNYLWSHLC